MLNSLENLKTAVLLGFQVYFSSFLDINTTVPNYEMAVLAFGIVNMKVYEPVGILHDGRLVRIIGGGIMPEHRK